jgi:two-component sensor histidine kinase
VDYPTFARMFDARLAALSRSQDLLVSRDWSGGDLKELIRGQLEPFVRDGVKQLSVEGPPLFLNPVAVQNIGMAMHELATNASKHGALSTTLGRIDVHWNVYLDADVRARLRLVWRESGGPETRPPKRRGFGRIVIEKVAPAALGGEAKLTWALDGLHWELDVPEISVVGGASAMGSFRAS